MSSTTPPSVHPNSTDLRLLTALTRYQGTTMPVIQRHLFPGLHRTGIYRRLRRLVAIGLLEDPKSGPSNRARPSSLRTLYVPTAAGYQFAGSPLRARPMAVATAEHTVAISEEGLEAERAGLTVWTDREIQFELAAWRQSDDDLEPGQQLWLGSPDGVAASRGRVLAERRAVKTHRPDLVIVDKRVPNADRVAVEIEFSAKSPSRLAAIIGWYAREGTFDKVRYVVRDAAAKRRVEKAIGLLPQSKRGMFAVIVYEPRHGVEVAVGPPPFSSALHAELPDGQDGPVAAVVGRTPQFPGVRRNLPTRPPAAAPPRSRGPLPTRRPLAVEHVPDRSAPEPSEVCWWDRTGAPGMWGDWDGPRD